MNPATIEKVRGAAARDVGTTEDIPLIARLRGCAVAEDLHHVLNSLMACAFYFFGTANVSQALTKNFLRM
jgi:hypothetical protein